MSRGKYTPEFQARCQIAYHTGTEFVTRNVLTCAEIVPLLILLHVLVYANTLLQTNQIV